MKINRVVEIEVEGKHCSNSCKYLILELPERCLLFNEYLKFDEDSETTSGYFFRCSECLD